MYTHLENYEEMEKSELLDTSEKKGCNIGQFCRTDCYFPKRYTIVILLFVGMIFINAQRVNVGVTVVAILHKTPQTAVESTDSISAIANLKWTNSMVGFLHSIFYIGLLISQVPCGYLVTHFPSHRLYGGCIFASCVLNFLLPVSIVSIGYTFTCIIRLLQGLIEGLLYPSCYDVLRIWALPEEKSRMGATVLTGSYIGPTIGMILSGVITHYWGWMYVYYVHGLAGILWYGFWILLAYENPSVHPTISVDERKLIEVKQGEAAVIYEQDKVPWKDIFTSLPVYALIVCNFARSSVFYMLLTNQPTYLNIFNFTFAENGLFSSLPHAFMALFCVISGTMADWLLTKPWMSATVVRKVFTCLGFGIEAFFFYGLALIDDRIMAVVFLTIGVGISGMAIAGWQVNHLDLAPRYAGILVAITMTFGTLAGVTNPLIVAALTHDQTLDSWHNVFWMTGSILLVSTVFYAVFGSGDRQPWATPRPPALRIVNKSEFLDGKPYGTFAAQTNLDSYQMETKKTKTDFDIADNNETSDDGISRTFNPDLLPDDDLARPADLKRRKSDVRDDT